MRKITAPKVSLSICLGARAEYSDGLFVKKVVL